MTAHSRTCSGTRLEGPPSSSANPSPSQVAARRCSSCWGCRGPASQGTGSAKQCGRRQSVEEERKKRQKERRYMAESERNIKGIKYPDSLKEAKLNTRHEKQQNKGKGSLCRTGACVSVKVSSTSSSGMTTSSRSALDKEK